VQPAFDLYAKTFASYSTEHKQNQEMLRGFDELLTMKCSKQSLLELEKRIDQSYATLRQVKESNQKQNE
jgi:hypothetical protein